MPHFYEEGETEPSAKSLTKGEEQLGTMSQFYGEGETESLAKSLTKRGGTVEDQATFI